MTEEESSIKNDMAKKPTKDKKIKSQKDPTAIISSIIYALSILLFPIYIFKFFEIRNITDFYNQGIGEFILLVIAVFLGICVVTNMFEWVFKYLVYYRYGQKGQIFGKGVMTKVLYFIFRNFLLIIKAEVKTEKNHWVFDYYKYPIDWKTNLILFSSILLIFSVAKFILLVVYKHNILDNLVKISNIFSYQESYLTFFCVFSIIVFVIYWIKDKPR